ncbi:MAG: hypothetical protein KC933_18105 [Myxococcales bacterium]|nr:hypothetical protein [Myxococcales bacterium]
MRTTAWLLWSAGIALVSAEATAAPIRVTYDVVVVEGSWQPLAPADLARAVEGAALEVLSRGGQLQLHRAPGPGAEAEPGAYRLKLESHVLAEAQTHTVALQLGPGTAQDLPSLSAARTVVLGGLSRGKMLEAVEASAREAAAALVQAMKAPLARLGKAGDEEPAPVDDPFKGAPAPWQWGPVRIPKASVGKAARDLYGKNAKKRQAALRVLTSEALTADSPRHELERCALEHPEEQMREGCLKALRPLSMRSPPTARVVVEVYRRDDSGRVRREANDQMVYFTGPARAEAVQAWLEAATQGREHGPLEELGDLPNLDLAIRGCLEASGKERGLDNRRRFGCISLLEPLPHARRKAILWRFVREMDPDSPYYLRGAGEREGSTGTPWQRSVDALLEGMTRWDPKLEEILWARYQRDLSHAAMSVLSSWAAPSERLAKRLLEMVQTRGENQALFGLVRIATEDAKLRPMVKQALLQMMAQGAFSKDIDERRLKDAVSKLEREDAR